MMRLNIAPDPWPGAPVVVLSAGLGGGGGYWLAQRAALEEQYQLVSYDHNGTGENAGPLPADYSMATMAGELFSALQAAGIAAVGMALSSLLVTLNALRLTRLPASTADARASRI